jgi:hypothetical protein
VSNNELYTTSNPAPGVKIALRISHFCEKNPKQLKRVKDNAKNTKAISNIFLENAPLHMVSNRYHNS